jgi:hypothetical protein
VAHVGDDAVLTRVDHERRLTVGRHRGTARDPDEVARILVVPAGLPGDRHRGLNAVLAHLLDCSVEVVRERDDGARTLAVQEEREHLGDVRRRVELILDRHQLEEVGRVVTSRVRLEQDVAVVDRRLGDGGRGRPSGITDRALERGHVHEPPRRSHGEAERLERLDAGVQLRHPDHQVVDVHDAKAHFVLSFG